MSVIDEFKEADAANDIACDESFEPYMKRKDAEKKLVDHMLRNSMTEIEINGTTYELYGFLSKRLDTQENM